MREKVLDADARSPLDVIAAVGLAVGGAFGMAGTFVPQDALRQELWAIDGAALVVATALLTVKFGQAGLRLRRSRLPRVRRR